MQDFLKKFNYLHLTGLEPVLIFTKTDYESGAFNHSATDAFFLIEKILRD
jgi:hypothetical protein